MGVLLFFKGLTVHSLNPHLRFAPLLALLLSLKVVAITLTAAIEKFLAFSSVFVVKESLDCSSAVSHYFGQVTDVIRLLLL